MLWGLGLIMTEVLYFLYVLPKGNVKTIGEYDRKLCFRCVKGLVTKKIITLHVNGEKFDVNKLNVGDVYGLETDDGHTSSFMYFRLRGFELDWDKENTIVTMDYQKM